MEKALVHGALSFNPTTGQLSCGRTRTTLTPMGDKFLSHLMKNAGQTTTYFTVTEAIWRVDFAKEIEPLRVFIRRLREKIGADH